jgi:hypothetical protein
MDLSRVTATDVAKMRQFEVIGSKFKRKSPEDFQEFPQPFQANAWISKLVLKQRSAASFQLFPNS